MNITQEQSYQTYSQYIKPDWAPPSYLFGPVWTFLYIIIFISFAYVFKQVFDKQLPSSVAVPFCLNLIFNFIFTPIQFGLQNNLLASLDIVLVWLTLVWSMATIYKYHKWVAYVQVPYLLWVTFATALQFTITYLNW